MKIRILILSAVFLLSTQALYGQGVGKGFFFGVRAGGTSSSATVKIDGEKPNDIKGLSGFGFGVLGGFGLSEVLAIQAEVLFGSEGFKIDTGIPVPAPTGQSADQTVIFEQKNSYINVPIFLLARFPAKSNAKVRLLAGASVGFETGCKVILTARGSSGSSDQKQEVNCNDQGTTKTKSTSARALFGAGFGYGVTETTRLFFDLGYALGLTNISDSSANTGSSDTPLEIKNNLLSYTLGVSVRMGS